MYKMSILKIKIPRITQAHEKCAMKMKESKKVEKKNDCRVKIFVVRKGVYKAASKE